MMVKRKYRITLNEEEVKELISVFNDYFKYMEQLKLGEVSNRTRLVEDLIVDLHQEMKG